MGNIKEQRWEISKGKDEKYQKAKMRNIKGQR